MSTAPPTIPPTELATAALAVQPSPPAAACSVPANNQAALAASASSNGALAKPRKRSLYDRTEAFISRLTSRSTFAHRLASLIWLPYAFRSGIRIKREGENTFSAILPFKKFNRNWYNAMAGASLLANSEIAGGMYLYGRCGGDYTVVCKDLRYKFLRPCFGPAIYRVTPVTDLDAMLRTGTEFNFDIELDIVQSVPTKGLGREVRVGKCYATFHITPKSLHEERKARRERGAKLNGTVEPTSAAALSGTETSAEPPTGMGGSPPAGHAAT